jgi:dTDP-4-amino-4,6-dideoxygalactose transaminase
MNFYKNKYSIPNENIMNSFLWGEETISLPLFPDITSNEQDYIVKVLLDDVIPMIGK